MTLKLEVGKTYIDSEGSEFECVWQRDGMFYFEAVEPSLRAVDLLAFRPDGSRPRNNLWRLVKEKTESKVWLNVYKKGSEGYITGAGHTSKDGAKAASGNDHSFVKRICLDLDNMTVGEV